MPYPLPNTKTGKKKERNINITGQQGFVAFFQVRLETVLPINIDRAREFVILPSLPVSPPLLGAGGK